jgi:hypothetical protein
MPVPQQSSTFKAAFASFQVNPPSPNPQSDRLLSPAVIYRVCRHDLFDTKDVQDTPTLTYTWLADQFGHFALGFGGTLAGFGIISGILALLRDFFPGAETFFAWPRTWSAIAVGVLMAAWFTIKEWRDYRAERKHAWSVSIQRPVPFAFNGGEILHNCVIACFYTFFGILIAILGVWHWLVGLAAFVVLFVLAARIGFWWLQRKVAFQQADLPYLYRLANFPDNFNPPASAGTGSGATTGISAEDILHQIVCGQTPEIRHALISGPLRSGKTSLAIGLGTEYAFQLGIARYTSVLKLSQTGLAIAANNGIQPRDPRPNKPPSTMSGDTTFQDGRELWPFDRVELLIIDDLDGGITGPGPIAPQAMLTALQTAPGREFFANLAKRRTVWVAGNIGQAAAWHNVVAQLIANGNLAEVALLSLRDDLPTAFARRPAA